MLDNFVRNGYTCRRFTEGCSQSMPCVSNTFAEHQRLVDSQM